MTALCPSCSAESLRWLDYRPAAQPRIASGAAYDDTRAGVADSTRARGQAWRNTIRAQQRLIREACTRDHQTQRLTLGELCAGYGGLGMAVARVFGPVDLRWVSEHEPPSEKNPKPRNAAARLLAHRHLGVPNHGDLTTFDWSAAEPVDVLTAGWPCQPWSPAGKRQGAADDRAIWPHVADAVRLVRPRLVVLENVARVVAVGELGRAVTDLARLGYVGSWMCLRASDVGAPHGRPRCFVVAVAEDADRATRRAAPGQAQGGRARTNAGGRGGAPAADPDSAVVRDAAGRLGGPSGSSAGVAGDDGAPRLAAADTASGGEPDEPGRDAAVQGITVDRSGGGDRGRGDAAGADVVGGSPGVLAWGQYGAAVERWERVLGRRAPAPTVDGRLNPAFPEWMMGLPAGWVTDVPGLSRADQLHLIGNGVCPQQAAAAIEVLLPRALAAAGAPQPSLWDVA